MLNDEYREVSETLSATYHCNYKIFATPERRQLAFDEWQSCDDQWQWCKDKWNRPEDINRVDLKDWYIERCKKIIAELEPRLRPEAELAYEQLPERLQPLDDFCGPRLRLPPKF